MSESSQWVAIERSRSDFNLKEIQITPPEKPVKTILTMSCCRCFIPLDSVKAMWYLFEHLNFDSPNNNFATLDDASELEIRTKCLLAGLTVNEYCFTPNSAWCEWTIENKCLPTEDDEAETKKPDPKMDYTQKAWSMNAMMSRWISRYLWRLPSLPSN